MSRFYTLMACTGDYFFFQLVIHTPRGMERGAPAADCETLPRNTNRFEYE